MKKLLITLFALSFAFAQYQGFNTEEDHLNGFKFVQSTSQSFIFVYSEDLEPGDTYGAYSTYAGFASCAGSRIFTKQFDEIPVQGNDQDTGIADCTTLYLPEEGDFLAFIIWKEAEQKAYWATAQDYFTGENLLVAHTFLAMKTLKLAKLGEVEAEDWFWIQMMNDITMDNVGLCRDNNYQRSEVEERQSIIDFLIGEE